MLSEDDLYTRVYPKNPLPFNIVDGTCSVCTNALKELNKYLSYSDFYHTVKLTLHKDSAGRGWHIQGYQLHEQEYVDLSDLGYDCLERSVKEVRK